MFIENVRRRNQPCKTISYCFMGVLNSCTSVTRWSTSVIDVGVVYVGIICGCGVCGHHMWVSYVSRSL